MMLGMRVRYNEVARQAICGCYKGEQLSRKLAEVMKDTGTVVAIGPFYCGVEWESGEMSTVANRYLEVISTFNGEEEAGVSMAEERRKKWMREGREK